MGNRVTSNLRTGFSLIWNRMNCILLLSVIGLSAGCGKVFQTWRLESVEFQEISLNCACTFGCSEIVITDQGAYEALIDERFKQYLDEHWERFYPSILEAVKRDNPSLTDEEYETLVNERMFEFMPFAVVKDCNYPDGAPLFNNPEIDFSTYTLIGTSYMTGGCKFPDYSVEVLQDEKHNKYIFSLDVTTYGTCERIISFSVYYLVPKLPEDYTVEFVYHTKMKWKW